MKLNHQLQLNLPIVAINDLKLHQDKLLAATQGRAFWILDDLTPFRKAASTINDAFSLLPVSNVFRIDIGSPLDRQFGEEENPLKINTTMVNPASGAVIYYHIQNKDSVKKLSIEVLDAANNVVRTYYSEKSKLATSNNSSESDPKVEIRTGLNRFVWDLRYGNLPSIDNVYIEGSSAGRKVIPGEYTIRLKINETTQTTKVKILADPRYNAPAADFEAQDQLSKLVSEDVAAIHVSVVQMRKVQEQLNQFVKRAEGNKNLEDLSTKAKAINKTIKVWEEELIQSKSQSNDDVINFINKLSANLVFLNGEVQGSSSLPYVTAGHLLRYDELHADWKKYEKQKQDLIDNEIKNFNEACRKANWDFVGFEN